MNDPSAKWQISIRDVLAATLGVCCGLGLIRLSNASGIGFLASLGGIVIGCTTTNVIAILAKCGRFAHALWMGCGSGIGTLVGQAFGPPIF